MNNELIVYINGEYLPESQAKISVYDHGVLFSDGVFEGIRIYEEKIFKFDEHIDRLYCAAKAIKLDIPINKNEMKQVVQETCKRNNMANGYIRLVVTRGIGDLGIDPDKCPNPTIFCIVAQLKLYSNEMYENGLSIITASQRRNKSTIVDPQIKSLSYLNNILAKIEANRSGAAEAVMLNEDGIVTECTVSNIFMIKDEVLYTPPTYVGALDGITRRTVISLAKEMGIEVQEREFTLFNLYNADECFLTGTGAEIIAVKEVDERVIGEGRMGDMTRRLLHRFREYVREDV